MRPVVLDHVAAVCFTLRGVAEVKGRLGRIGSVTRQDTAALSWDVPLEIAAIKRRGPPSCRGSTHSTGGG